jgi:hypothetical protein
MPSPKQILAAVRELEPQLPSLLGTEASSVQSQLVPLKEELAAGRTNGEDLLQLLRGYPAVAELLQQQLEQSEQSIITPEASDEAYEIYGISRGSYQQLAGEPTTAIPGTRYICPVPECSQDWFQIGLRTPPLCEEHGVVMVLARDEG